MLACDLRFWILVVSLVCAIDALSVSDFTKTCKRSDPNLDACVLRTANELHPKLKKGVKQLRVPSMDPMVIPKVQLNSGSGPVALESTFTNVHIEGLASYEIRKIHVDFDKREIQAEAYVPSFYTRGKYEMNGKILSLPINGNGDSQSNYTGVTGYLTLKFKPETKNGKDYWTLEKSDFDLDVKHASIHMDNLFNGNKQLGDTMNTFISENWQAVFQELKPAVRDTVNAIISDIVTKLFGYFPIDEIFPQ